MTFYAVYFKSRYFKNGKVQTFTAPMAGWYKVQLTGCWGSSGGASNGCAPGTRVTGEIYFRKGETVGVMLGLGGISNRGGWNGGGAGVGDNNGSGGGGRSDIRTTYGTPGSTDWQTGYTTDILTAGGGGGAKKNAHGYAAIGFDQNASTLNGTYADVGGGGGHKGGKKMKGGSSYYLDNTSKVRNAYVEVPKDHKDKKFHTYCNNGCTFTYLGTY